MISIITAAEKEKELQSPTAEVQQCLADAAKATTKVPFTIKPYPLAHTLFGGKVDFTLLSQWLKEAGWCLKIEYTDTGNNAIVDKLTVRYYRDRGYTEEEAIVQIDPGAKNSKPEYF
jgi:hypothetical protein